MRALARVYSVDAQLTPFTVKCGALLLVLDFLRIRKALLRLREYDCKWRRSQNPAPLHKYNQGKWALIANNSAKSGIRLNKLSVPCKLTKFSV